MQLQIRILLATLLLSTTSLAEDPAEPLPSNLFGFLKPKMYVGIRFVEGSASVNLSIYDADEYAVALDVARGRGQFVDAVSMAKEHEIVRAKLDAHMARSTTNITREDVRIYPLRGYFFGTVMHVADDYVLVEYSSFGVGGGERKVRVALNTQAIARIYLDSNSIMFTTSPVSSRR